MQLYAIPELSSRFILISHPEHRDPIPYRGEGRLVVQIGTPGSMTGGVIPLWEENHAVGIQALLIKGGDISDDRFFLKIDNGDRAFA